MPDLAQSISQLTLPRRMVRELQFVSRRGACSRSDLHRGLGLRKNTVGQDIAALTQAGLVVETVHTAVTNGRPGVLLQVDGQRRHVLGLAIEAHAVACGRVSLSGRPLDDPAWHRVKRADGLVDEAARLVRSLINRQTLAIGLSVPGFIDLKESCVLFSAAWPQARHVRLDRLVEACDGRPLIIDSLTNAIATRRLLEQAQPTDEDHLFVYLTDGRMGATLMVQGSPIRGSILGSSELGHVRLPTRTPRCYCGQQGCLERIFSTAYLRQLQPDGPRLTLAGAIAGGETPALRRIGRFLALGLANAVNFTRIGGVTLMTDLPNAGAFMDRLTAATHRLILPELSEHVRMETFVDPQPCPTANAAAVARARLFIPAPGGEPGADNTLTGLPQPRRTAARRLQPS